MKFIKKYAVYFLCLTLLALLVSFSYFNQSAPDPNHNPETGSTELIPSTQAPSTQETFPTTLPISEKFADKTDEELIEAILLNDALESWNLISSFVPYSDDHINWLKDKCPEFAELMSRDTAVESLNTIAPDLIDKQMESEDPHDRLKALALKSFIIYLNRSQNGTTPWDK